MSSWSEGDGTEILATGVIDATEWTLERGADEPFSGLSLFAGDALGSLPTHASEPIDVAVTPVGALALVWGLLSPRAVAVRVGTEAGGVVEEPVLSAEVDGRRVFVVPLPPGQDPSSVEEVDGTGAALHRKAVVPEATGRTDVAERIEVRSVQRPSERGRGTVVLEGAVDDATWEYAVHLEPPDWQDELSVRTTSGWSRGSGRSPIPGREAIGGLGVGGSGLGGRVMHVTGWADGRATDTVLYLATGERLRVPTGGRSLGVDVVVFAVVVPAGTVVVAAEAFDDEGRLVARAHLRGQLSWLDGAAADDADLRARTSAPVPSVVRSAWEGTLRTQLVEPARPDGGPGAAGQQLQRLRPAEVGARWPFRPLLIPAAIAGHGERWILRGNHERWEIAQVVSLGLLWISGPGLDEQPDPRDWVAHLAAGAVILRQVVSWSDPNGERDPPNTRVRGLPALLRELTAETNNLDHVTLSWQEPAERGVAPPMSGVFVSFEAHPRHHSVDQLRRYAERLTQHP